MKSYTDIPQSKTLSKILPLESADMKYISFRHKDDTIEWNPQLGTPSKYDLPCWSLSALLGVLPYGYSSILTKSFNGKDYYCKIDGKPFETEADNPIDACYEMILKLNELKML